MSQEPAIRVFRTDRPGIRKVLGDLEAEIMEVVWTRPPGTGVTAREVFERLYARRRIAYTTVMNTMARLARKQLLRADKQGQTYVYYATASQDEFVSRFVSRVLEDLLVGFTDVAMTSLERLVDPTAVARVQQLFDEIARRRQAEEGT
jgi:predicted transcriptional regulator